MIMSSVMYQSSQYLLSSCRGDSQVLTDGLSSDNVAFHY